MQKLLVFLLVLLPWLNPFAFGPSPNVAPVLFAWACAAGGLLAMVWRNDRPAFFSAAIGGWVAAACISAVLGVLQYFDWAADLYPWVNQNGLGNAFANLRQRNQFATLCTMGLACLMWVAMPVVPKRVQRFAWLGLVVAAGLLALGNATSSSRTGGLQFVVLLCLALLWSWSDKGRIDQRRSDQCSIPMPTSATHTRALGLLVGAIALYLLASYVLPQLAGVQGSIYQRVRDGDSICGSRLTLWANVIHLITMKPWLGWGWGELDFAHFDTLYAGPRFCDILGNAHNLPLQLAVELGLPLACLLVAIALYAIYLGKPWAAQTGQARLAWSILAVIGVHSLLEYPLWYGPFQIATLLCIYMIASEKQGSAKRLPSIYIAWVSAAVMAGCLYVGFAYWRISQLYLQPAQSSAIYREATFATFKDAWLFNDLVLFAANGVAITPQSAAAVLETSKYLLHFSPEERVVQRIITSAVLLNDLDTVSYYTQRYKAAFPEAALQK